MVLESLNGIQCDKPDCRHTRFVQSGELPEGFTLAVTFVRRPDANGPQPVTVAAFACRDTHIKDAVREALRREGE